MKSLKLDLSNIKGDLLGGITAGIIGLPLCLAFGATSGLGPAAGLYGGIVLGVLAAFFGGTPTQCSAPTGPMTVVSALIIAGEIKYYGDLEHAYGAIVFTFALAGLFQILLGVLKLGKYINYLPYPVISGFMSGIGVIVITMQFPNFFGVESLGKSAVSNIIALPHYMAHIDWHSFVIAIVTLTISFIIPRITKVIPGTLVAIFVGTFLSILLGFDIKTIGEIPAIIPDIKFDDMFGLDVTQITHMILPALSLGALGMIDSLLTSVIADKLTKTKHNSNRELVGQGIGNIFSAMVGGLPGAGTTVVTVTNTKTGGRTRLSGIVQGLFLAFVLFVGGQYAAEIPYAVLAGLLINIGVNIVDHTFFKDLKVIPKSDLIIVLTVFILTVAWSLLYATAIGFVVASIFFMKKMSDTIDEYSQGSKIDLISKKLINLFDDSNEFKKDVYIKQLNGPIFFGFANRVEESTANLPNVKTLILDMKRVPYIDQTGMYALRDTVDDLALKGIEVYFTGMNKEIYKMLHGIHVFSNIPEENIFEELETCVLWIHDKKDPRLHDEKIGIHIPSAITPNGDGTNDTWDIRGLERYKTCFVKVTDETGTTVFESHGYGSPWDGTKDNKPLPSGKYFYNLELVNGKKIVYEGEINLVR